VKGSNIHDLDFLRLKALLPMLNEENNKQTLAILADTKIIVGAASHWEVTGAGWLCFAKDPQLKREFRNSYIEFQVFKGSARDNPIRKYEIKGNLTEQIEQAIQLLKQYIWMIPTIEGIKRIDIPAYPDVVLREVITNSVVHRDYRKMHCPVKIAMFDNRIEIENPGGLMPGLTIYNLVHKRDWRNPLLAELMKKFGFGDMDGQGIDRLYATALKIKIPPPVLIDHQNSFTLVLSAPKDFEDFSPEEKKLMIIIMSIMNDYIDNQNIRSIFGISSEKASTLIKSLVADNVLQTSSQSRKFAKYSLTENYKEKIFG
jgi:ATP-dependent DNA helicase RecG